MFVKHVLELEGAARWENGTLWKKGGMWRGEGMQRGREIFDEAPGVSLMRSNVRKLPAFFQCNPNCATLL